MIVRENFSGGLGLTCLETVLVVEALAYGCSAIQLCIMGPSLAVAPLIIAGNEEQKKKYLGMLVAEPVIAVSPQGRRKTTKTKCLT